MKFQVLLVCIGCVSAANLATNPIQKVLEMISDLEVKVIGEGEDAHKLYEEFAEMCEDRSRDLHFNIKTEKGEIVDLKATIEEKSAAIATLTSKIEDLAGSIAEDEAELKKATGIRKKEAAEFAVAEKELLDTIDTIERASGIIERELQKGSSLAQLQGAKGLQQALAVLLQASSISSADGNKLTALLQSSASDEDAGAPAAAVYENQSGGILDALGSLLSKAEEQLDAARKEETTSKHNFELLEQSLQDEIKFATKDMAAAKKSLAENKEKKATAEGDLSATSKDLAADTKALADLHHDCMTKASDYEDETKSRGEELKALATAKKIIKEATGGADGAEQQTYGLVQEPAFLQVSSSSVVAERATSVVRRLAASQHSAALTQLVTRLISALRTNDNPFAKVEALISDMIQKLEKEAEADATKKAWCDKEMAENAAKKEDKSTELAKLNTKIEQKSAQSAKLKEEVATLQKELAALAKEQAEMDKVRQEENAAYTKNKPEMEKGLEGITLALKVLRDYYAKSDGEEADHKTAEGSASGIIGLLEVAESDFTKGIAEMTAQEESAAAAYEKETKENEIVRATKQQDVKYKTKESASLDKAVAELTADSGSVQEELDAVLEYGKELDKECVAKAETYDERVARRNAELAGLKEALEILSNDASADSGALSGSGPSAVLVQKNAVHRTFRGSQLRVE